MGSSLFCSRVWIFPSQLSISSSSVFPPEAPGLLEWLPGSYRGNFSLSSIDSVPLLVPPLLPPIRTYSQPVVGRSFVPCLDRLTELHKLVVPVTNVVMRVQIVMMALGLIVVVAASIGVVPEKHFYFAIVGFWDPAVGMALVAVDSVHSIFEASIVVRSDILVPFGILVSLDILVAFGIEAVPDILAYRAVVVVAVDYFVDFSHDNMMRDCVRISGKIHTIVVQID